MADDVRMGLSRLRNLSTDILGLSDNVGFLELVSGRSTLKAKTTLFVNKGAIHMSNDTYSAGQAGAMGQPSAQQRR